MEIRSSLCTYPTWQMTYQVLDLQYPGFPASTSSYQLSQFGLSHQTACVPLRPMGCASYQGKRSLCKCSETEAVSQCLHLGLEEPKILHWFLPNCCMFIKRKNHVLCTKTQRWGMLVASERTNINKM